MGIDEFGRNAIAHGEHLRGVRHPVPDERMCAGAAHCDPRIGETGGENQLSEWRTADVSRADHEDRRATVGKALR